MLLYSIDFATLKLTLPLLKVRPYKIFLNEIMSVIMHVSF